MAMVSPQLSPPSTYVSQPSFSKSSAATPPENSQTIRALPTVPQLSRRTGSVGNIVASNVNSVAGANSLSSDNGKSSNASNGYRQTPRNSTMPAVADQQRSGSSQGAHPSLSNTSNKNRSNHIASSSSSSAKSSRSPSPAPPPLLSGGSYHSHSSSVSSNPQYGYDGRSGRASNGGNTQYSGAGNNAFTYPQMQQQYQPTSQYPASQPYLATHQPSGSSNHYVPFPSNSNAINHPFPNPQYPFIPSPHPQSFGGPGLYSPGFGVPGASNEQMQMQAIMLQQAQFQQQQWQMEMMQNQQQQQGQRRRATSGPAPASGPSPQFYNPPLAYPPSPSGSFHQQLGHAPQSPSYSTANLPYPTPPGSTEGRDVRAAGPEGYHPYRRGGDPKLESASREKPTIRPLPASPSSRYNSLTASPATSSSMSSHPSSSSAASSSTAASSTHHTKQDSISSLSASNFTSLPKSGHAVTSSVSSPAIYAQAGGRSSSSSVNSRSSGAPQVSSRDSRSRTESQNSSAGSAGSHRERERTNSANSDPNYVGGAATTPTLSAVAVGKKPSPLSQQVGSRAGTPTLDRPSTPATLRGVNSRAGETEEEDSDSTAAPSVATPKEKKGMKYKFKRAFSSNSISELTIDGKGASDADKVNRRRRDSTSSVESAAPRTPPAVTATEVPRVANASSSTTTKSVGKRFGILNPKMNSSTDNLSISSTVSSASMMIRKIGQMGKLARRSSLMSLTKAFKGKDKDAEKEAAADKKKGSVASANVSHVTAEVEGTTTSGMSPAAALARKQQQHYAEQEAARQAAAALAPPTRSFDVHARTDSMTSETGSIKSSRSGWGRSASKNNLAEEAGDSKTRMLEKEKERLKKEKAAGKSKWGLRFGSKTDLHAETGSIRDDQSIITSSDYDSQATPRQSVEILAPAAFAGTAGGYRFGGPGTEEQDSERLESPLGMYGDEEYEPSMRGVPLGNHRKDMRGIKGILKGAGSFSQEDYALPRPGFPRTRADSFGAPHQTGRPGSPGNAALVGRIPSQDQIDGFAPSTTSARTDTLATLSSPSMETSSPYSNPSLNASAPVLKSTSAPLQPIRSTTAPSPRRRIVFAQNLSVHTTWPASVYDRRAEPATCNKLTPILAQRIKEELNSYKMEEMEVHPTSRQLTHFSRSNAGVDGLPLVALDSFIRPARIQVLLVPIHPIKRAKFERYADLIRGFSRIQLADVPADTRGERAVFSSSPTTPGTLLFEYTTPTSYASSHPLAFLSEFQIHRRIHGIIGILDCSEHAEGTLPKALAGFQNSLSDLPRTFATKVYGFEPDVKQVREGAAVDEAEGLVMIPGTGDVAFYLNTLLADFASEVLWEFSNMAAQLESATSIPTPQETAAPLSPFTYIPNRPTAKSTISSYTSSTNSALGALSPTQPTQRLINLTPLGIAPPPQSRTAIGLWGGSQSGNQDGFLYGKSIQSNMTVQKGAEPSLAPGLVDQKARKKILGREKKLMADMWLLAGRLSQAISCYNEAILLTKGWQDQVWQASALEGLTIATVIQAWAPTPTRFNSNNGPLPPLPPSSGVTPAPLSDTSAFLSSIPDRLSQAIALYAKMLPEPPTSEESPPLDPDRTHPLIYAEACLRCARFLLAVWEAGGWIERALDRLILPPPRLRGEAKTSEEQARSARLTSLAPSNTVPRSSIASWVSLAYNPQLASLALPIRLRVTGEIASIFGRIGYRRKESFVLRELAALCGDGVGGKRIGALGNTEGAGGGVKVRSDTIPEEGEDEVARSFSPTSNGYGRGGFRDRSKPTPSSDLKQSSVGTVTDSAGNESVIRLSEKVCEAFGIEVIPGVAKKGKGTKSVMQGSQVDSSESGKNRFGWPVLQVGVLRDAISIAEALPDYQAAIRFTVTALRTLSDTMPKEEQFRLSQNIPRVFAAATRRGLAFDLDYWGPTQLVMSLEVTPLSHNRLPFEHPYQDVAAAQAPSSVVTALGAKDPFIYNPKKGPAAARARPTIVLNEVTEVMVTLQNPFLFELEIQNIGLSTSGVSFACDPLATTIPAGSFHTVRLSGTPRESGLLVIRGCNVRLAGCTIREFVLPVWNDEAESKRQMDGILNTSGDRFKMTGLAAFGVREVDAAQEEGLKFLECMVVPEMPMLWMRSTSLTHGALMLYDGETSTIRIGLENTSSCTVDFVKLTFSDMHTTSTLAYIEENDLTPAEIYELQTESTNRPVFTYSNESTPLIPPGATVVLEVQCLGKVGCGTGTIQIDYSYIDRDIVRTSRTFHTRQLFCDVFMTVHKALVTHSLNILPIDDAPASSLIALQNGEAQSSSSTSLGEKATTTDPELEQSVSIVSDNNHCLVSVDIMNSYGQPFEVNFERTNNPDLVKKGIKQRLEPGATARMLVRIDKIVLSAEQLAVPIPSLSTRQFVVSKVKRSLAQDRLDRELFWYREELLKLIQGSWNEVGSQRSGTISLRGLRMSHSMLQILRGEEVSMNLSLVDSSSETGVLPRIEGKSITYATKTNEFLDVVASVTNHSAFPLEFTFHLEIRPPGSTVGSPLATQHLSRFVLLDSLPFIRLRMLQPGESEVVKFTICLLTTGRYDIGGVLEEDRREEFSKDMRGERRSHVVRERIEVEVLE